MLPPGSRNWQLIYPNSTFSFVIGGGLYPSGAPYFKGKVLATIVNIRLALKNPIEWIKLPAYRSNSMVL